MRNPPRVDHGPPVALITITVMLGLIMAIIDSTIVNVAISTIGGNLGATVDEVAWVATGYILANVVIMPLNGWLTALFGRKTFYAASLALFTVASFFCGTARSIWVLVFYRIIQGIGGGALQPTAQAILFETFPVERRGAAMAIFGMGAMVGPAIGPTLGGWIVDNASWPLIFYINIPIGIAAFLMTLAFIPSPKYIAKPKGGIDWIALGLLTAGLASLQFVLEQGERDDWFQSQTIVLLQRNLRRHAGRLRLEDAARQVPDRRFERLQVQIVLGRLGLGRDHGFRALRDGADPAALLSDVARLHRVRHRPGTDARRAFRPRSRC